MEKNKEKMKEGIDKHTPGGIRKYMSCKVVGPKYE